MIQNSFPQLPPNSPSALPFYPEIPQAQRVAVLDKHRISPALEQLSSLGIHSFAQIPVASIQSMFSSILSVHLITPRRVGLSTALSGHHHFRGKQLKKQQKVVGVLRMVIQCLRLLPLLLEHNLVSNILVSCRFALHY